MLIVRPLDMTIHASQTLNNVSPVGYVLNEEPALAWRLDRENCSIELDLGPNAQSFDTIAVLGTNLRAQDRIVIEGRNAPNPQTIIWSDPVRDCFTGSLPLGSTSKVITKLPAPRFTRYVRIYIAHGSPIHPDGFISIQRIIIGKSLTIGQLGGVELGAEQSFIDQSQAVSGAGWTSFRNYSVLPQWKVGVSFIDEDAWRSDWMGFLQSVGRHKPFLFLPDVDNPQNWQAEAIYGRIQNEANTLTQGSDARRCELVIRALAP